MKSAYGKSVPEPRIELTHVEAGSPMGELLRRYWQPACLSEELTDVVVSIPIVRTAAPLSNSGASKRMAFDAATMAGSILLKVACWKCRVRRRAHASGWLWNNPAIR
jgi:hypothetical protein